MSPLLQSSTRIQRTDLDIQIAVVTHRGLGQSVVGVLCQVIGTLSGCLLSLVAWYIVEYVRPDTIVAFRR